MEQAERGTMPLHERAEPVFRVVAGAMAAVFASIAVLLVLAALDGPVEGVSGGDVWWQVLVCVGGASYGAVYAWKGGSWIRALLGRAAWPARARRD